MIKILKLKRKDGDIIEAVIKKLDLTYIDKIMALQKNIIDGLENPETYAASKSEEFESCIKGSGTILGVVTSTDELIAMGVYMKNGYDNHNYGYDIELKGEELLKVGQIESTVVMGDYRGNKLQRILCECLEDIGNENDTPIMCATASPYNEFSVNTFISLGYEIKADKLKYGGLRRYVLVKTL